MTNPLVLGCGEWGFRNRTIPEYFATATALGFRHLEFGIGGGWTGRLPDAPTASDVAAFRRLAEKHAVTTRYCCLENDFTRPDPAEHAARLRTVLAQLPPAADCGAQVVRLFAGFNPADQITNPIWQRLLDALSACAALATRHNMKIAIETHGAITRLPDGTLAHQHTVTTRRDWLARLMKEMPPDIGFNFDPGNLKAADPTDTRYAADLLTGRILYCHLKDWRPAGSGWLPCAPGDDTLDYSRLLPIPHYTGIYLIEYEPLEDTIDGLRRSLTYLRRTLPTATLEG